MFQKFLQVALQHKIVAGVIIILVAVGGYYSYKAFSGGSAQVRYISATAQKGTLIVSVSGSGQVSASDQVDIKSKVSGEVIYVGAKNSQQVKSGTLLVQFDKRDAQETVEDAKISLEQAKIELEKMQGITTETGSLRGIKEKAEGDLNKAYEDGFNNVANVFLDLPSIMAGLYDTLFSYGFNTTQVNIDYYADAVKNYDEKSLQYRNDAYNKYQTARATYEKNFQDYKAASRFSDKETIESLINQTYETMKDVAEAVKSANNLIQFYQDKLTEKGFRPQTLSSTHLSDLNSYTGKTNTFLSNLLSTKNTIQSDKEALVETDFDIADQKIKVKQAENALNDAQNKLADYSIHAPFSGTVAKINVKKGDSVSGTTVATLVSQQRLAEITLNEVDVAKVKLGQKVNITFDAIEGLNITGEVVEVDTVGTVTQGVVTYGIKIGFDTQDERVKPGMSVSTAIITDMKQDVLLVPNSAIKSNGNGQYVEVLTNNMPQSQSVETGLSNDTMTEIMSGLQGDEQVVTQTITANTTQTQSQSTGFRIPGLGGAGR